MTLWWQRPQVQELLEKYRELSERERILVLITSHVLIAAVYLLLIATPLWTPAEANRNQANRYILFGLFVDSTSSFSFETVDFINSSFYEGSNSGWDPFP